MEIQLEEGDVQSIALTRFMVAAKIWADRTLNRWGVVRILRGIWPEEVAPCIREVGMNLFSISFRSEKKVEKALSEGPWTVMGYNVILKRWKQEVITAKLGQKIKVVDPMSSGGLGRNFLRLRAGFDVCMPLIEGFWVPRKNKEKVWASVKYERLVDFCYSYGLLGHVEKMCREEGSGSELGNFGPHMKVPQAMTINWRRDFGDGNKMRDGGVKEGRRIEETISIGRLKGDRDSGEGNKENSDINVKTRVTRVDKGKRILQETIEFRDTSVDICMIHTPGSIYTIPVNADVDTQSVSSNFDDGTPQ
ncbi:hypothetical protein COLO4_09864 [Corchorus olitorius]|uniref:DUF4283 domain-containing protein n=1 Tax=Corchorus olitorius TaxID=93759 RepID=A0A1R3KAW3_9ROSI|nr:hypothetical protein COLO4_09864 [Corchorus olitorius]